MAEERIALRVAEEGGLARRQWPLTTGPLPRGAVGDSGSLWLAGPDGKRTDSFQIQVLSRWPDESLKWVLVDFQGKRGEAGEQTTYELCYGTETPAGQARHRAERGLVRRGDRGVHRDLALRNQTRGVRALRPGGAVCRHPGRAYQLSGERRYLEVGQRFFQQLIEAQDWGDDPRKRGAVAMNPTAFSLRSGGQIPRFASEDR